MSEARNLFPLLQQSADPGIVGAIETHFEIPHQELEADTADCLDKLERMGLLQANGHGIASSSSQGRK